MFMFMTLDSHFWSRFEITFTKFSRKLNKLYSHGIPILCISTLFGNIKREREFVCFESSIYIIQFFYRNSELFKNVQTTKTPICIVTQFALIHTLWSDKTRHCIYYVV